MFILAIMLQLQWGKVIPRDNKETSPSFVFIGLHFRETVLVDRGAARILFRGGLELFVRKVYEKKLFNANFVHFSHNFRNLRGGLDSISPPWLRP